MRPHEVKRPIDKMLQCSEDRQLAADDPHFNSTVNPVSINQNFKTDLRDDLTTDPDNIDGQIRPTTTVNAADV